MTIGCVSAGDSATINHPRFVALFASQVLTSVATVEPLKVRFAVGFVPVHGAGVPVCTKSVALMVDEYSVPTTPRMPGVFTNDQRRVVAPGAANGTLLFAPNGSLNPQGPACRPSVCGPPGQVPHASGSAWNPS
jgi:hypothetical protein